METLVYSLWNDYVVIMCVLSDQKPSMFRSAGG